jgi:UDP-glucose 4-epimerase
VRLLITGVSGLVGSGTAVEALQRGHEVVGVSRRGEVARLRAILGHPGFHLETGDLAEGKTVARLFDRWRPAAVLHAAARTSSGGAEEEDGFTFFRDNVLATLNVLHHARRVGVGHLVFSSSIYVYGVPEALPVREDHPTRPVTAYGISKLEGEMYGRFYSASGPTRVTVLRYSTIYDPTQKGDVVDIFARRCLANAPISLYSRGEPSSDPVWSADVVRANLLALERADAPPFGIYNIGGGTELSIAALAEMIKRLTRSQSILQPSELPSHRSYRFVMDIAKARDELGYVPTDPETALQRYLENLEVPC